MMIIQFCFEELYPVKMLMLEMSEKAERTLSTETVDIGYNMFQRPELVSWKKILLIQLTTLCR